MNAMRLPASLPEIPVAKICRSSAGICVGLFNLSHVGLSVGSFVGLFVCWLVCLVGCFFITLKAKGLIHVNACQCLPVNNQCSIPPSKLQARSLASSTEKGGVDRKLTSVCSPNQPRLLVDVLKASSQLSVIPGILTVARESPEHLDTTKHGHLSECLLMGPHWVSIFQGATRVAEHPTLWFRQATAP